LATDPVVPCTAVGRTVRDVGERFSASIAPGGGAAAASSAGSGLGLAWVEKDGTAGILARAGTSKALTRMADRPVGPRMEYLQCWSEAGFLKSPGNVVAKFPGKWTFIVMPVLLWSLKCDKNIVGHGPGPWSAPACPEMDNGSLGK
jgi:hypothetical protein